MICGHGACSVPRWRRRTGAGGPRATKNAKLQTSNAKLRTWRGSVRLVFGVEPRAASSHIPVRSLILSILLPFA